MHPPHLGRAQPRRQLPAPHLPQFMGHHWAPPPFVLLLLGQVRSVLCGRAASDPFWLHFGPVVQFVGAEPQRGSLPVCAAGCLGVSLFLPGGFPALL